MVEDWFVGGVLMCSGELLCVAPHTCKERISDLVTFCKVGMSEKTREMPRRCSLHPNATACCPYECFPQKNVQIMVPKAKKTCPQAHISKTVGDAFLDLCFAFS